MRTTTTSSSGPRSTGGRSRPRRLALVGVACAAAVLGGLQAPVSALPADRDKAGSPGAAGIGDDYFPRDGNGGYDVSRYSIHDRYRFAERRLSGWTRITLTPTKDLTRFNLDFLLDVGSVKVDGRLTPFRKPSPHELQVDPPGVLPSGRPVTVTVRYDDHPSSYSYAGERNWLADAHEVVAMNQPHMAPWWFPSNDHPLDKATVDVHITVPAGLQVVSNGMPTGHDTANGLVTWHWRSAQPMVPYLAFFAAGSFDVARGRVDGRPWLVAVSKRLAPVVRAEAMSLLQETPGIVRWIDQQLGAYPFDSSGGLVTGLDPGFALENQTRPTYPSWVDHTTVVHELAHQWFGDDVAVHHWSDIWLNEGSATYMEVRWAEGHGGQSTDSWLRSAYAGFAPWSLVVSDPGADHIFDFAVYQRGAMTLAALRNRIGDADFTTLLRTWVADHHAGNGSTAQFRALAASVSGEDLDAFFTAWLDTPAKPADTTDNGLG